MRTVVIFVSPPQRHGGMRGGIEGKVRKAGRIVFAAGC